MIQTPKMNWCNHCLFFCFVFSLRSPVGWHGSRWHQEGVAECPHWLQWPHQRQTEREGHSASQKCKYLVDGCIRSVSEKEHRSMFTPQVSIICTFWTKGVKTWYQALLPQMSLQINCTIIHSEVLSRSAKLPEPLNTFKETDTVLVNNMAVVNRSYSNVGNIIFYVNKLSAWTNKQTEPKMDLL